jgi:signal transduction histidine kinase
VYTTKLRKKGGDFIWAIFAATPLYDKNGAYLGSLVLVSDITKLKQTEEHLRYEKSKGDMYLDMMSHDINNMNQAAMGFMELARDKLEKEGSLSKDDLHLIVKPIESLKRASELLENIKTLQKLRTGKIGSEVLDVSEILAQVIDEQASVSHRNIDFNYFQRENCPVKANLLLKEAFRNIIGNAIKHSSGPLTINLTVKCMKENNKSYCEVVCEDNGPGIQDNVKRDLFQRYRSGNTKTPGMGLGLYIVKTLIDSFGGRVWVEDRVPGDHTKGAKFVIMLPEV